MSNGQFEWKAPAFRLPDDPLNKVVVEVDPEKEGDLDPVKHWRITTTLIEIIGESRNPVKSKTRDWTGSDGPYREIFIHKPIEGADYEGECCAALIETPHV